MALIQCPECGKKVSDKAAACPHCGIALDFSQQTEISDMDIEKSEEKFPLKPVLIIAAAVAVIAVIVILVVNLNSPDAPNPPDDMFTPSSQSPEVYEVYMIVSCVKNPLLNQHDVEILLDNKKLDTLAHGTSKDYPLSLSEGSHKLLFRLNDYPTSYADFSVNVAEDMTVGFEIKCGLFDTIEVTRK